MCSLFRFLLGVASAAATGAATAFVMLVLFTISFDTATAFKGATLVAVFTLVICLAFSLVIGALLKAVAAVRRREPSLSATVITAMALGGFPFAAMLLISATALSDLAVPAMAMVCSITSAAVFWRVTTRTAPPPAPSPSPLPLRDPAAPPLW